MREDRMAVSAAEWQERMAAVAAEPGFERLLDPATPVLVWSADAEPLWTSRAGGAFLGHGRVAGEATRRLRDLAAGIAPASGFRLERLRWRALDPPVTVACRRLGTPDGEVLLTAVIDKPSRRPDEAGRGAREGRNRATDLAAAPPDPPPPAPEPAPRRPVRFTWQADREGRFTAVSDSLADCVGAGGAAVLGRTWSDLVGLMVEDTDGEIARLWTEGVSWSRRPAMWRDPERERLIPVELSGTLVAGGSGRRGYGLAFPDEAIEAPPGAFGPLVAPVAPPDAADLAIGPPEPAPAPPSSVADDSLKDAMAAAAALTGTTGGTVFSMMRAWFGPQLAPSFPGFDPPGPPDPARPEPGPSPSPAAASLTGSERGALDEIARALRNDLPAAEGAPDEASQAGKPSADILPWPATPRRVADPSRLLDALPIAVAAVRDRLPLFANRALLDALGFADLPDLVARGALTEVFALELTTGAPVSVSLPTASGSSLAFEGRAVTVPWGDMDAKLVLLSAADAAPSGESAAMRLELKARDRRHEEMTAALDLAADGVATLDGSARLLSLSRSAERLFGVAANEVVGDSLTVLIEPRDHRIALACLDALRTGTSAGAEQCDVRGRTREGATVPLAMRAGHMEAREGEASFSVAFRDVSAAKMLETELREAREVAERASANRADFLARVSHEIRTPLTAITGFAELMLEERFGTLGNERYKGYIHDIHESGIHVISLVNDLLDLAKATSDGSDLSPGRFDLNAVAQQCVTLAGPLASRERTILRTSFAPLLPAVWADERSVRQIVLNILSNAIRFTGAGGQVIVSTAPGGPTDVLLSVRDTGEGMDADEIEAALTPFRQVAKSRRGDGTGLGLPLSKALAEANGGLFTITSRTGQGTLVEVRFPLAQEGAQAVAAE